MKLRFLLMGCIISALGAILLIAGAFSTALAGVLRVGIVLFVVGLVWKQSKVGDCICTEEPHTKRMRASNSARSPMAQA